MARPPASRTNFSARARVRLAGERGLRGAPLTGKSRNGPGPYIAAVLT